jgi:hypothetical protein
LTSSDRGLAGGRAIYVDYDDAFALTMGPCDYVCDRLAEADTFWLAVAQGPKPSG